MTDRSLTRLGLGAAIAVAAAALLASCWSRPTAIGMMAGGAWNLASLHCLVRMLRAWLGAARSTRRALGWLLLKLGVLYPLAIVLIRHRYSSILGFSLGVTIVLFVGIVGFIWPARRFPSIQSHGR